MRWPAVAVLVALACGCGGGGGTTLGDVSEAGALVDVATNLLVQECLLRVPGNLTADRVAAVYPAAEVDEQLAAIAAAEQELQEQTVGPPYVTRDCRWESDAVDAQIDTGIDGDTATVHVAGTLVVTTDPPIGDDGPLDWEIGMVQDGGRWRLAHVDAG